MRFRAFIILALLLCVFANAQCIARCTVTPCDRADVPPCHQSKSHIPGAKSCDSTLFAQEQRTTAVPDLALDSDLVTIAPDTSFEFVSLAPPPFTGSSGGPTFTILRV